MRKYKWTELLSKYHEPCLNCILNPWEALQDFKICDPCLTKFMDKYRYMNEYP